MKNRNINQNLFHLVPLGDILKLPLLFKESDSVLIGTVEALLKNIALSDRSLTQLFLQYQWLSELWREFEAFSKGCGNSAR